MGAVMGSKLLKAIVIRGTKGVSIANRKSFDHYNEKIIKYIYSAPSYEPRSTYGTSVLMNIYNAMGTLPVRNSQLSFYQNADEISGEALVNKHIKRLKACFACPVHCSRYYEVNDGPYANTKGEGAEFETIVALGSRCDNNNLESILYANNLCNQYGMDTISIGGIISFAMECYEKGLITKEDTDGLELSWGNHEVIIELITKIAHREGFGNVLAEGVKEASQAIPGSKRYALHVKGLELPAQDIRGMKEWGLGFAVSSRGADHLRAYPVEPRNLSEEAAEKLFGTKDVIDRLKYGGKAKLVKWSEEFSAVTDCLEICKMPGMGSNISMDDLAGIVTAITGVEFIEEELLRVGERIINLERLYNNKMGVDRKDDTIPERFQEEPISEGNSKGEVFDLNKMLDEYYQIRGWDEKGFPTEAKLSELGLSKE
jgi:aldehyde:ferredoxin oxidoreductase